jgi:Signal transduction histidine kinase
MGDVDERWGELENLRQKLEASEQEREQMLVALEDAHAEVRRLAEQVDRLQADNRFLTRSASELTGRLSQCQVRRPDTQPQNDAVHAQGCMAEELRVTIEELQVTAEDLEEANVALRELNQTLERRVEERTAALKAALAERDDLLRHKDTLIREVEHRVKNSLQMVASLLNLQGQKANPETRQALQIAIGRIHAVARVHALLYAKGGTDNVRFDRYLQDVCANLAASFGVDGRRRTLLVEADPATVPVDVALALATVVNELVTNALRYAFAVETPGTIWVQFRRESQDRISLTVADDGRGLPRSPCCGLGLQIVSSIAEGLRAEMSMDGKSGARVMLSIPAKLG